MPYCITLSFIDFLKKLSMIGVEKIKPDFKMYSIAVFAMNIWLKVFKNGPSKIYGRQPLKILLGPFLNTLSHIREH